MPHDEDGGRSMASMMPPPFQVSSRLKWRDLGRACCRGTLPALGMRGGVASSRWLSPRTPGVGAERKQAACEGKTHEILRLRAQDDSVG